MSFRFLLAACFAVLLAPLASAQYGPGPYGYDGLTRYDAPTRPPVQIGVGVGPWIYLGPDILTGDVRNQDDVVATNLAITGEVLVPVAERVRARAVGGVVNLGADSDRADVPDGFNPFLTGPSILAEADLLFDLVDRNTSALVPYAFGGLGALFATDDAADGVSRTSVFAPLGLGLEYQVSDKLSIFGEASYRFGLNSVGEGRTGARALFGHPCETDPEGEECKKFCDKNPDDMLCMDDGGDPCDDDPSLPGCDPCDDDPSAPGCDPCDEDPNAPGCDPCDDDPTLPGCDGEVGGDPDSDFRSRFNSALFTGGLRLGLGGAPAPRYIPDPIPAPVPTPPVVTPVPTPTPAPQVCDLVELNAAYFGYGSADLDGRARALLNENVELLLSNDACCVFIDGYTDTSEYSRYGMGLAGRRAQAVYDYYLSRNISANRLQIRNRGVASPPCDKEDPGQGCSRNRRVESIPADCERLQYLIDNPSYGY